MFTLVTSLGSPYGRKVRIVADLLGVSGDMPLQDANTLDPNDPIVQINPLGKIPALAPDGGKPIFDSRVIVDYLCKKFDGERIIPADGELRGRVLTLAALAEGVTDALLLIVYEGRYHDDNHVSDDWLKHQFGKVRRGLTEVVDSLDEFAAPNVAAVTLACALGYIDFRKQLDWRAEYPALVQWLDDFAAAVPAWETTKKPDA